MDSKPSKSSLRSHLMFPWRCPAGCRHSLISIGLCVLALVSGGSVFYWLASLRKPPPAREPAEKTYKVEVFDVERLDLQEILSAFGTARPDREVIVAAKVAGEVIAVSPRLEIGESVQAAEVTVGEAGRSLRSPGDLLLTIDPRSYQERLTQAENRLDEDDAELQRLVQEEKNNARMLQQANKDLEDFDHEYERIEGLVRSGVLNDSDFTQARLERRRYEQAIIQSENQTNLLAASRELVLRRRQTHQTDRTLAELDISHTEVRPPFSGILSEVTVEKGQYVRPGDPLVRLTDVLAVDVPIPIALDDYAKIAPEVRAGRHPYVELAETETAPARWNGYVERIAPEADESTRTVKVFVRVDNALQEVPLLPGTFVHARIAGPQLDQAIVIPRDAIVSGRVFLAVDGRVEERTPRIKRTLQTLAVLETGIDPKDQVILTNLDIIQSGARVDIELHRTLRQELERQRTRVVRQQAVAFGEHGSRDSVD